MHFMYTSFASLSQSEMDVILDTNIYTALLLSQGRKIFSSNAFVELFTYLRRTKSNLIVPGPVFHEVIREYSDLISSSIKKVEDSWTTLHRNAMSELIDYLPVPPERDEEIKAFQKELLKPGVGFEVIVLENYKNIALGEVVRRGVNRIRPASDNGEELRDVVIWLVALEHAKARDSRVAFITNDGNFKGSDGNLHPDLLQDLATHNIKLHYYDSIPKFVRGNALERSVVTAGEIAALMKEGVISDLVTERLERAFEDVMVSNIEFQSAEKYRVEDNSFYVEAKYITVVRYSEITRPLNPYWPPATYVAPSVFTISPMHPSQFNPDFPSVQSAAFSGIGQRVPISSAIPTTLRTNYEAVLNLVLSFRAESGTTQSVEILEIDVSKNTKLSEVPGTLSEDYFIP
jgi:hypothetical protein